MAVEIFEDEIAVRARPVDDNVHNPTFHSIHNQTQGLDHVRK